MREREMLLRQIQQCDFALYELQLYLDTHPHCREAMQLYRMHLEKKQKAEQLYVEQYGPLQAHQSDTMGQWNWTDAPWPWEQEAD
jgi:spore coat protein JB